jgi:O-antigen/teichoic acid export membrane protein
MLSRNTTNTIASKTIILITNFALVIFTTHIWGSQGRGEIALVIANISIITIFSNVFCGGTIAWHTPKLQRDFLLWVALGGAILISLSGAIIFSLLFGFKYFGELFGISLLLSLITSITTYWLGENNITNYNLLTILNPTFILISLTILYFIVKNPSVSTYFNAYYVGLGFVLIIGISGLFQKQSYKVPKITLTGFKSIVSYGINNEFSYLIQFLNYRLSYYFIAKQLGLAQLGIFSIVVAISEAVWIISRSMSAVHFSNVINSDDPIKNRNETIVFAKQSLCISLVLQLVGVLIPVSLYQFVFGNEFSEVRKYILYLLPGITAIAVSNLYGHYFSASGKLKILRDKSLIGLVATILLLPFLITRYQLTGVCITLNISYFLSSLYLWFHFRKEGQLIKQENFR